MTFPFKTSFSRWCSSSFPYAQSVHIFPYGPIFSHLVPYSPIWFHIFPSFPIYFHLFREKKHGFWDEKHPRFSILLPGTVQVTCQLPVQREDHQSRSVPCWRELSWPQEIQAIFHTLWLCQNSYWKCTIYSWFTYSKWWFSIAMLIYQRVPVAQLARKKWNYQGCPLHTVDGRNPAPLSKAYTWNLSWKRGGAGFLPPTVVSHDSAKPSKNPSRLTDWRLDLLTKNLKNWSSKP